MPNDHTDQKPAGRLGSGDCRCAPKFAKPTVCPIHGLQSKPITKPTKPRGQR